MAIAFNGPWISRHKSASARPEDPQGDALTLVGPPGSLRMLWSPGPDGRLVCRWVGAEAPAPVRAPERRHLRLVVSDPEVV